MTSSFFAPFLTLLVPLTQLYSSLPALLHIVGLIYKWRLILHNCMHSMNIFFPITCGLTMTPPPRSQGNLLPTSLTILITSGCLGSCRKGDTLPSCGVKVLLLQWLWLPRNLSRLMSVFFCGVWNELKSKERRQGVCRVARLWTK